ncbi:MAG: restriction endonuclease, partial [Clostridia bacterium]|nr:restriction endonuclease [Clostridia bacterium]
NGNVLNCNFINVLITTSDFTKGAIEEAISNPNNPTILINGEKLLDMCIENGIGFTYKPVLVKETIKSLFTEVSVCDSTPVITIENYYIVSREITANDIRARILIIPQLIKNTISANDETITVVFNGSTYQLNIDKTRRYLGGVTDIYKQSGLINEDNIFISKQAKWKLVDNVIHITIE